MSRITSFNDMLASLIERGARLVDWSPGERPLGALCAELLSTRGEASGVAMAAEILTRFAAMEPAERRAFFDMLADGFDVEAARVTSAATRYQTEPSAEALADLVAAAEPRRQELFRRLNFAPGGTEALVEMRASLLEMLPDAPELARVDADFRHLLASWFNRGFLVLQPIDWRTPAHILEKIIAYEAVHQIDTWEELRRRLEPADRRCFAFFHPAMPDEPLVFVEVALSAEIPASIQAVLAPDRPVVPPEEASTAVFYSISNCQRGLNGISFGAFLIKQVAQDLASAHPGLRTFVTLSPVPGFARWLGDREPSLAEAAAYLITAKRADGQPLDPVARFHLGNGAQLARLNWMGDRSAKGLAEAHGLMVNYLYDLDQVEARHEDYAARRTVHAAWAVRALVQQKSEPA
ncbi:MAG: malonyl-CoA decarboxylase [Pseudomonadota bacterium]